jgi:hypothetical protein
MGTEDSAKTTAYRVCAWCGSLIGVKHWASLWEESTVTHGVCEPCAQELRRSADRLPAVADDCARYRTTRPVPVGAPGAVHRDAPQAGSPSRALACSRSRVSKPSVNES